MRSVRRSSSRVAATLLVGTSLLAGAIVGWPGGSATTTATAADEAKAPKRLTEGCRESAVRFGVVMAADDERGRRAAEAISEEIGRQIGCRTLVVTRSSQPAMLAALALHQVDVAQVDSATFVVGERTVAISVMGAYSAVADTPARVATAPRLWAREDGPVSALADVAGRRIALGPELTAAGDLAPRAALLAAGVPTGAAVGSAAERTTRVTRAEDDASALAALRAGDGDVALTVGDVSRRQARGLRVIWTGEPPLANLMVIRPGVPNEVRRLLLSAVRDVPGELLAPLAARQGIEHPIPLMAVPPELYDPVSDRLDALTSAGLVP